MLRLSSMSVIYHCAACGGSNRIPRARLGDDPTCGHCKRKVFPRAPVEVSDATWQKEVEDAPLPTLVDLWAPWCGPCRMVGPTVEKIAAEQAGKLKVVKLNVDHNPRTASRFDARSIPTLLIMRGAVEVDRIVGAVPKAQIEERLRRVL
jgi:thioredoxin 2